MRIERVDLIQIKMPIVGHFETSYGRRYDSDKLILKFYTPDFETYTECVAGMALAFAMYGISSEDSLVLVLDASRTTGARTADGRTRWVEARASDDAAADNWQAAAPAQATKGATP